MEENALEVRLLTFVGRHFGMRMSYYFIVSSKYSMIRTRRHKQNRIWSYDEDFTELLNLSVFYEI